MQTLHKDWLLMFADTKYLICETLDPDKVIYYEKNIIDDILLYSNHVSPFFITFIVLLKCLQNTVFILNSPSMNLCNHALSLSTMI